MLTLMQELLNLRKLLIAFAEEHVETIMIGYTHTQQAQPTTVAHYLKAVIDQLTRDYKRMQAAYTTINRSSMGAAALTTTGFPISRERMQELLAFDDMIENAWDAVAGADYITEAASTVQLAALNLGRTSKTFTLGNTGVQCIQTCQPLCASELDHTTKSAIPFQSSILVHYCLRLLEMLQRSYKWSTIRHLETSLIQRMICSHLWRAIDRLVGIYKLFGSLIVTMDVNKENLLKRAQNSLPM